MSRINDTRWKRLIIILTAPLWIPAAVFIGIPCAAILWLICALILLVFGLVYYIKDGVWPKDCNL